MVARHIFCFLLCDVSFCLDIHVNSDNSVKITDSQTQQSLRLVEGQSSTFCGLKMRHCHNYLKVKNLSHIDSLFINSEAPLFFWVKDTLHLSISAPQVEFRKASQVQVLELSSRLVTVGDQSIFDAEKIDFKGEKLEINGQLCFPQDKEGELNFLDFPAPFFEVSGRLQGESLKVSGNYLTFRNMGTVKVTDLHIMLSSQLSEIQQFGFLNSSSLVQSFGRVTIGGIGRPGSFEVTNWILLKPITVVVRLGKLEVTNIRGLIDSLILENDKCFVYIEKLIGEAKHIDNAGGSCKIFEKQSQGIPSDEESTVLLARCSAYSYIGKSNVPLHAVVARDNAFTEISNTPGMSFARVDSANLNMLYVHGVQDVLTTGQTNLNVLDGSINEMFLKKGTVGNIEMSKLKNCVNDGDVCAQNTYAERFLNRNRSTFSNRNSVDLFENSARLAGKNGELFIKHYVGDNSNAEITIDEVEGAPLIESEEANNVFQGRGATIYADKIGGKTTVTAKYSTLHKGFVPGLRFLGSNVSVFLDYMPNVEEFPQHEGGYFHLHVSLSKDYVNESKKLYGDAIFFIDMNGYDWKNINADFVTKGLEVRNAGIMGNYNGRLSLEEFLSIKADEIINAANPVTAHGNEIAIPWGNSQQKVHCYVQQNQTKGIFVKDKDITFDAKRVENRFATIATRRGKIVGHAQNEIRNTVGTFYAQKKSKLSASKIINEDLGVSSRMTVSHGQRSFFGVPVHYDLYTAELVNNSGRAEMIFGDGLELHGSVYNIGSSIKSGGKIDISDCPFIELRSVLNNCAEMGGTNINLKTQKMRGIAMQLWSVKGELDD